MNGRTYLDHNATSPLRTLVREAMIDAMTLCGNPSSIHFEGRQARDVVEQAREKIAAFAGCDPHDVLFTSGGTEANNTALSPGVVAKSADDQARALCFVSAVEHPSVMSGGRFRKEQLRVVPVTGAGVFDIDAFIDLLEINNISAVRRSKGEQPPFIVSVMLANNETGVVQPVTEIAGIVLERGGMMHCDAVQALGRMPFDLASTGVDLMTINAHKIGGPKGVGALIGPGLDDVLNDPLQTGGGQEYGRRGGTENVIAIAGFAVAAEIACEEMADREMVRFLRDRMETRLTELFPSLVVFSEGVDRIDNTSMMAVPGISADILIMALDLDGISISSGAACSSGKVGKSQVLNAMGVESELARCAFRVSFGAGNWLPDVDRLIASMQTNARHLRNTVAVGGASRVM